MKKLMLLSLLAGAGFLANAQKVDSLKVGNSGANPYHQGKNELRINVLYAALGLPEINYERILNEESAVGIGLLLGLEDDTNFSFGAIPYYRVYFGSKPASGFFIEGNAAVMQTRDEVGYFIDNGNSYQYVQRQTATQTNFGLGAAAGGKFLTKRGFIGEAYFGLGRLFGNSIDEVYPRLGITIGKRF